MTCAHVLGLIDAGPFADYPREHLNAAWAHARQCATCGPALQAAHRLASDLAAWPQPVPPSDLAAGVLARIARLGDEPPVRSRAHDWSPPITVLGGLTAGVAIALSTPPGASPLTWAPILAAGLGVYAVGLFAPLAGKRPRQR
jgi:hypothetical protein